MSGGTASVSLADASVLSLLYESRESRRRKPRSTRGAFSASGDVGGDSVRSRWSHVGKSNEIGESGVSGLMMSPSLRVFMPIATIARTEPVRRGEMDGEEDGAALRCRCRVIWGRSEEPVGGGLTAVGSLLGSPAACAASVRANAVGYSVLVRRKSSVGASDGQELRRCGSGKFGIAWLEGTHTRPIFSAVAGFEYERAEHPV